MPAGFKYSDFIFAALLFALILFFASILGGAPTGYISAFEITSLTAEGVNIPIPALYVYVAVATILIIIIIFLVFLSKELHAYRELAEFMEKIHLEQEKVHHEKKSSGGGRRKNFAADTETESRKKRRLREIKNLVSEIKKI